MAAALLLLAAAAPASLPALLAPCAGWARLVALAQDDPLRALSEEYAELESQGLKENFHRRLSFLMLQEYLPPGARMTSGYRSPQKQLDLIQRLARAHGIPVPGQGSVEDESSWRPALMALRAKGFIVAAPTTTPHATDEAVFDISGADLNAIQDGLRRAEKAGMVKFRKIIFETQNNAVHVEVESLSPKALNALGRRRPSSGGGADAPTESEADQGRGMMAQLQSLHDGEPDPSKKIDYDRSIKNLLDPVADAERSQALDAEIARHQQEAQALGQDTQKQQAIVEVSQALRDERYADAERAAAFLTKKYPDVPQVQAMLKQVRTRRLVNDAAAALYASGEPECGDCERAAEMLAEALELSPNYEGAQFIGEDIEACQSRCRTRRLPLLILFILMFAVAGVAVFFLIRSGKFLTRPAAAAAGGAGHGAFPARGQGVNAWVLEGVEGACRGQVYQLNKPEIIIGSKGPPEGAADIVVADPQKKISRRHCTVMQDGKRFYLIDDSTNGTKLNGSEVAKGVLVEFRSGDRISLADRAVFTLRPG
jgi:hypothetical protein